MIYWLQKYGGYTSTGLTLDEKKELEQLRVQVKKYREMEQMRKNSDSESSKSESDDSDDDIDTNLDNVLEKMPEAKKKMSLIPRSAVSAEAYGKFNRKEDFKARYIEKTPEQISRIKTRIIHSFLFGNLESKDLDIVIGAMEEKKFKPGETFGELALLYNAPRAATIKAKTDCVLWVLDRETFNNIVKDAAQKKREKYESFLKKVDILSTIEPYELMQISDAIKTAVFHHDDYIIKEGEMGDVFYILEEGECVATKTIEPGKPEIAIKDYKEGDYFGERALMKGEPRYANIVAKSDIVKVISLDRVSFKRLLGPIEELLKRNMDKYQTFVSK